MRDQKFITYVLPGVTQCDINYQNFLNVVLCQLLRNSTVSLLQAIRQSINRARDHSRHCPLQYLENTGLATTQSDWLILFIGPLATLVV